MEHATTLLRLASALMLGVEMFAIRSAVLDSARRARTALATESAWTACVSVRRDGASVKQILLLECQTIAQKRFAQFLAVNLASASTRCASVFKVGQDQIAGIRNAHWIAVDMASALLSRHTARLNACATTDGVEELANESLCTSRCALAPTIAQETVCAWMASACAMLASLGQTAVHQCVLHHPLVQTASFNDVRMTALGRAFA